MKTKLHHLSPEDFECPKPKDVMKSSLFIQREKDSFYLIFESASFKIDNSTARDLAEFILETLND